MSTLNGKLLESLELKSDKAKPGSFVKLSNHGQENYQSVFRLERFEVREWDGHLPDGNGEAVGQIINAKGEAIAGTLGNFNPETGELQVLQADKAASSIKISEIRRAQFPSANAEESTPTPKPDEQKADDKSADSADAQKPTADDTPAAKTPPVNDTIEVELIDRSRLTGKWIESAAGKVSFEVKGLAAPLHFEVGQLVGLVGDSTPYKNSKLAEDSASPKGRLQTPNCELSGAMVGFEDAGVKTFLWQAESAVAPVTLTEVTSGKVEFGASASKTNSAKARATAEAQAQAMQIRRAPAAVGATRAASSPRARKMTIGLEFRTGDVVEGTVKSVDEKGVTFTSENTQTTFVPHSNLESITLRPSRDAVNETPQKLERLMTVPRSMKADPPTHLLISTNGDYLRGRLVSLNESKTILEVRLDNVEIPTEQIAQIYWLHDRQWDKPAEGAKGAENKP